MSALALQIQSDAERIADDLVKFRRDLHRHPEIRFAEKRTAGIVAEKMKKLGLDVRTGIGKTGVVAVLKGAKPGKCVALRADMDAIEIPDRKSVDYKSCVPNVTHACGHDGHVAVACGVAEVLARRKDSIPGAVVFLFQPSEEMALGGPSGAATMIQDGALRDPSPDAVFGLHCWPQYRAGTVGVADGPAMAGADSITFHVHGEGSHAGMPHCGCDAIVVMSQCIVALHHIIPRNLPPSETAVLHIGKIEGGVSRAILAEQASATGTLRTLNERTRSKMKERIQETIRGICAAYGARCAIEWSGHMPPVINDAALTELVRSAAHEIIGRENTIEVQERAMTAEDFTLFIQDRPGFYLKLGTANAETGESFPLHHSRFDIDERALPTGVKVLSMAILRYLGAG